MLKVVIKTILKNRFYPLTLRGVFYMTGSGFGVNLGVLEISFGILQPVRMLVHKLLPFGLRLLFGVTIAGLQRAQHFIGIAVRLDQVIVRQFAKGFLEITA